MRLGKVSENVLKRSVLKYTTYTKEEMAQGPAIGQDCAIVRSQGLAQTVLHTGTALADRTEQVRYAVLTAANNLYCVKAQPSALTVSLMLPADAQEVQLQQIMHTLNAACTEAQLAWAGGHTTVSDAVQIPVMTVTAAGCAMEQPTGIRPDLDLVMAGYPALEGTAMLAREGEAELKQRFPLELVETAMQFDRQLLAAEAAQIGWDMQAAAMHDVSEGGVFGALWEFCESRRVGLDADLKKIPIRQETIEICEYYDRNPYQLLSGGCLLMAVPDGETTAERLAAKGITAAVIGRTTDKREKVIRNGEERRFLDKPAQDEIWKEGKPWQD